jgi:glycosyltransferase involved in cell wall biosynthesis
MFPSVALKKMTEITDRTTKAEPSTYRVLVICNDSDYFLRHRLYLVTHLVSVGVDVTVITGGPPIAAARIQGWEYIHLPMERFRFDPIGDVALATRTIQAIRSLKPDAVHLITLKPAIFSGLASVLARFFHGYPKRILITLPGLGRMMSWSKGSGERRYPVGRALTILAMRFMARRDNVHFSFETKYDRDFWTKRGVADHQNSSVLDGAGVDLNLFHPSESTSSHSRKKVIFASRLLKSKGLNAFLMMARELANRPDVQFVVAGLADDQDPDAIRPEDLEQLSEIRFLGQVDDMPPLLRECDIVCLPTRYGEGIPRILIEAAATGLASIVSDHPGCRAVIEDGVTGQVLPAKSDFEMSRNLSSAVVRYLENPELLAQHKRAAYQAFQSRDFSQDACVARFTELLGWHQDAPT